MSPTHGSALLLLAVTLGGCVRAHDCPACGAGPDLATDGRAFDGKSGDAVWEAASADAGLDLASTDLALPDAADDQGRPDGDVTCLSTIFTADVEVVFDHSQGYIEELTYKPGSNHNVVDVYWNYQNLTGLGRLVNESGTQLVWCKAGTNTVTFDYVNTTLYGKKTLVLTWGPKGLVVDVTITNLKSAAQEGGTWKPGGANDSTDWFRVLKPDQSTQDFKFLYPGNYQGIWNGTILGVAVWDENFDEAFGYRYPPPGRQVVVGNGMSVDGPKQVLPGGGTYSFSFAIMHKADLLSWLP